MKLLLDTHVFIWVGGPEAESRLSSDARQAVENGANQILVSAASAWEIATKHRLGRLDAGGDIVRGWSQALSGLRAGDLAVTSEHGLLAGSFNSTHRDPFDRILAAQAIIEAARLVTADPAMRALGADTLW